MSLDRQSIEKRDFPVGRRGYDPDAVDAHLSALADEIQEFRSSTRRRADTLASSASEQVRAIVEAAENSAAEIQREAEQEAREIREGASNEAGATREQASEQAREHIGKVSEATSSMLQRLDAIEQELTGLIESLRTGANRISADLQLLEGDLGGVGEVVVPRPRFQFESEPEGLTAADGVGPAGFEVDSLPETELESAFAAPGVEEAGPAPEAAEFQEVLGGADTDYTYDPETQTVVGEVDETDDAEGARLIALNMALNGTPREETARYLSENFQLSDAGGLLDEVYASVEG